MELYGGFDLGKPPHPERAAWLALRKALAGRNVTVERYARVACPARGLTLASGRLDTYHVVVVLAEDQPAVCGLHTSEEPSALDPPRDRAEAVV